MLFLRFRVGDQSYCTILFVRIVRYVFGYIRFVSIVIQLTPLSFTHGPKAS